MFILGCYTQPKSDKNPFSVGLNVPIDYSNVSANDIEEYANITLENIVTEIEKIKENEIPTIRNTFVALDDVINKLNIAKTNCEVLFMVSPDSASRSMGIIGYQLLDSMSTSIFSDKTLYDKILNFNTTDAYQQLHGHKKILVDNMNFEFKQSGISLKEDELSKYIKLSNEINQLTFEFLENINASNEVILIDTEGVEGLPENFKSAYKVGDFQYEIPVKTSTLESIMNNAKNEETRKSFYKKFYNVAADKNLAILDKLVLKRYELTNVMGFPSYATYNLKPKMAGKPEVVWGFLNDLVDKSKGKAKYDIELLTNLKKKDSKSEDNCHLEIWDRMYYTNRLMKLEYNVNHEEIREYLPIENCLQGILGIFQELLVLEFKKVQNPSVWHKEVEMYDVFEGTNLKGRFYLDLFPRPNKESWFYGINLKSGNATENGYEVPVALLLGNFT